MRIIMIDDNGRQSDITNEVQNILRGTRQNGNVASDREQMPRAGFAPQQGFPAYGSQRPQQTPFPQGRFVPQGGFTPQGMREERPQGRFTPQGGFVPQQEFIPQGEMIPIPVDEFGNPMTEIPEGESFEGFIPQPAPMDFNGQAQRPMMERPVMAQPAPMEFNGHAQRPMMERPTMGQQQPMTRFGGSPSARNFEEAAHRFAQHMVNGNRHMPMGSNRPAQSPNYRRSY